MGVLPSQLAFTSLTAILTGSGGLSVSLGVSLGISATTSLGCSLTPELPRYLMSALIDLLRLPEDLSSCGGPPLISGISNSLEVVPDIFIAFLTAPVL